MYRRAPFPRIFLLNPWRRFIRPGRGSMYNREIRCALTGFEKIIERYCGRALKRVAETVNTRFDISNELDTSATLLIQRAYCACDFPRYLHPSKQRSKRSIDFRIARRNTTAYRNIPRFHVSKKGKKISQLTRRGKRNALRRLTIIDAIIDR